MFVCSISPAYDVCVPATLCTAEQFQCRDGRCITNSSKCNQVVDCEDASDEMNCCESLWTPDELKTLVSTKPKNSFNSYPDLTLDS